MLTVSLTIASLCLCLPLSLSVDSTIALLTILSVSLLRRLLLARGIRRVVALLSTVELLLLLVLLGNKTSSSETSRLEGVRGRLKVGSGWPEGPRTTKVHLLLSLACQVLVLCGRVILP